MQWTYAGHTPQVASAAFVAPSASLIGRVELGAGASVWYGCVLRGDVGRIQVGARSNIQDGTIVHVSGGSLGFGAFDTLIGDDVTVGHQAILHGCQVASCALIGMGATLLDGVVVESWALVAAGSVVPPGMRVPAGMLVMGTPARVRRPISEAERTTIRKSAPHYVELAARHRELR